MIRFFKGLLGGKKVKEPVAEAPYKVETPEAKVEAVNAQPIAEVAEAKPAKSKKAPAKPKAEKKPAEKKPAKAKKAPAKKAAK